MSTPKTFPPYQVRREGDDEWIVDSQGNDVVTSIEMTYHYADAFHAREISIMEILCRALNEANAGSDAPTYSESQSLDEVLAGNALFFLLNLRPMYNFINQSDSPREVKDCLRRINLAAEFIEGALGRDGNARAKLERLISQNRNETTDNQ